MVSGDRAQNRLADLIQPLWRDTALKFKCSLSYFWALSGCHIPSKYLASRDYYDQKRGQGKRHNQALIALAHRRLTVLFAMIRDGSLYDVPELKIA